MNKYIFGLIALVLAIGAYMHLAFAMSSNFFVPSVDSDIALSGQ